MVVRGGRLVQMETFVGGLPVRTCWSGGKELLVVEKNLVVD